MATKTKKRTALDIALELEDVRTAKAQLDKADKQLTAEFKEVMHDTKQKEAGNYKLEVARGLTVADEKVAFAWANTNRCLKVDTSKAKEILRHTFEDPSKFGFSVTLTERVAPKSTKEEQE